MRFMSKLGHGMAVFIALWMFVSSAQAQTYQFNTSISTASVPNASISSTIDSTHATHIAWVEVTANGEQVMYGKYTQSGEFTSTTVSSEFYRVGSVAIVTDDSNNPHITYFIKRDDNPEYTFTRTGNYAVYYAGSSNGGGAFSEEQVSTNVNDRHDNSDGLYHCYVNGRPQIGVNAGGQIVILYSSDASSLTGYDNYAILAMGSAGSWSHSQEFNIDDLPNISHDKEFEMLLRPNDANYLAWIDISNYAPQYMVKNGSWSNVTIAGYTGSFDNKHAQVDLDDNGVAHYFWRRDTVDDIAYYHTTLNGSTYGSIDRIGIDTGVVGNLGPATVDAVTGKLYFISLEGGFSLDTTHLIEFDPATQTQQKFELTGVGVPYGKRSLHADNGFISYTGGSDGTTLYITHLDAASLGQTNTAPTISGVAASSIEVGAAYSFSPSAQDADGDSLSFSASNLPSWLSLDTATGAITGTPTEGDVGAFSGIVISVSDGTDTSALPAFSITVSAVANSVPVISGSPANSVLAGEFYSFTPSASDGDGDSLSFSATNVPVWASFDSITGSLTGTPVEADEGVYSGIVISVSDGSDEQSLASFSITVSVAVTGTGTTDTGTTDTGTTDTGTTDTTEESSGGSSGGSGSLWSLLALLFLLAGRRECVVTRSTGLHC